MENVTDITSGFSTGKQFTTVIGVRQKAPEFGVSNAGRDWGRTVIAVDLGGYTKLVNVFTTEEKSIAALKRLQHGDRLSATGELTTVDYVTNDGRQERLIKIPFATGLRVIKKRVKP